MRFILWPGHAWIAQPLRIYLGGLFVYACVHKILHPAVFALDVATYDVLPLSLINPMAIMLPWMELAVGVMLLVAVRVRAAALVVAGMMVMFIVALILALASGLDMSCGCFASQAVEEDPISGMTILRDCVWLLAALHVAFFDRDPIRVARGPWSLWSWLAITGFVALWNYLLTAAAPVEWRIQPFCLPIPETEIVLDFTLVPAAATLVCLAHLLWQRRRGRAAPKEAV
ncbi:MAG: DoxX family membrane protein [Deltaproteobacteria bacterium]|nr:DoxX family membrane protein [Deltaproteobacteria bacterium]